MGSISGLSGSAGGASSLRGFGGLASGMDRDSLIESMTYATRSKIAQQKQKKDTLGWKQTAMRSITSKMHEFSSKYASYSSPSNLLGSKLFSRTVLSTSGDNSKFLSVSGTGSGASMLSVLGVKQMAQNSQVSTIQGASTQSLTTGEVKLDSNGKLTTKEDVSLVAGKTLAFNYGNKRHYVTLKDGNGYDYSTPQAVVESINKAMKEISVGDDKTLADVVKAEYSSTSQRMTFRSTDTSGNTIELADTSTDVLEKLGFLRRGEYLQDLPSSRKSITEYGLMGIENAQVIEKQSVAKIFSEKEISFSYNGSTKWITLDKFDEATATPETIRADLQKKLDEAFGKNRIQVKSTISSTNDTFKFDFQTVKPDPNNISGSPIEDKSSTFAITAADRGLLGNMGILGIADGKSNRLNLSSAITESGLIGLDPLWADGTEIALEINDAKGPDAIMIKKTDTISDIISKINNSEKAGVMVSYQSNSDRFAIVSKEKGASGDITLGGAGAKLLFGATSTSPDKDFHFKKTDGKDAILFVKYAGSDKPTEITRDSNTISVDGLNITLKGIFGYSDSNCTATIDETQSVTFDARVDADNTAKVVKEMITAYNEMLELINQEVSQKPNRDYQPLTDEQKADMSEDQINKWEEEAKKGLFFNDADLRSLMDNMRFILPNQDRASLSRMGITVSTDYSDSGKLVFDEQKFKTALSSDPDGVKEIFIKAESKDAEGNKIDGGLMTKMKTVMDRYASMTGSTKGILVERAGSAYAPTSILSNAFQKQIDSIDTYIDNLTDKLKMEQSRYIAQFSSLESLISKMNSQSSYLSGMTGGM